MGKKVHFRMLLSLGMALLFGFGAYVVAVAKPDVQTDQEAEKQCRDCHPTLYKSWEHSAHGQALVDPTFQESWIEQGEPQECLICHTTGYDFETNTWENDGITCKVCHSPMEENHPLNPMPTDRSAALCEKCHKQTVFEWKISKHRQTGLDCVDCHGQHSTTLRAEDASALCASCHRERASNFAHSAHSEENLSCPDCHLETLEENPNLERGHIAKDHSFRPILNACNECHSYQMHDPVQVHSEAGGEDIGNNPDQVVSQGISAEPDPVNPVSFAILSALIGMAVGLLLSPWIQEWYQKLEISLDSETDQEGKS